MRIVGRGGRKGVDRSMFPEDGKTKPDHGISFRPDKPKCPEVARGVDLRHAGDHLERQRDGTVGRRLRGLVGHAGAVAARIFRRAADLLEDRVAEPAEVAGHEIVAAPSWIGFNVRIASAILRHASDLPAAIGDRQVDAPALGTRSILRRQAAGVVLGIAPWNAPVTIAVRAVAGPLACGNTAVLKASELCPGTHAPVAATINDAGLPPRGVGPRDPRPARGRGGGRGADRPSGGAAGELPRLDPRRPGDRGRGGVAPEALGAGAVGQVAADRARGCRYRRGRRGGGLRRLLQPGPDQHVDRANHGRGRGGRRFVERLA